MIAHAPHLRLVCAAAAVLAAGPTFASGAFETWGVDPQGSAKALATVASDDGAGLAHTNPAAMATVPVARLGFVGALAVPALRVDMDNPRGARDPLAPAAVAWTSGLTVGAVVPLAAPVENRLWLGAVLYVPPLVLVRIRAHDPARPFFYRYDSATDHFDLDIAAALRVVDGLAVGVGVRVGAGQTGATRIAADAVRGRITDQTVDTFQYATYAPTAAVRLGPFTFLPQGQLAVAAAFVYREPTAFHFALPVALRFDGLDVGAEVDVVEVANYAPRTVGGGVHVDAFGPLSIDAEVQFAQWSQAPPPFVAATARVSGEGLTSIGLNGALDVPAAGQERVMAPGFTDTLTPRVGVTLRAIDTRTSGVSLHAGYALRPTPVPDQTSGTNIIDARAHVLGAGASLRALVPLLLARPITVDLALQAQVLEPRRTEKRDLDDPVGAWRASGAVVVGMCGLRYQFD